METDEAPVVLFQQRFHSHLTPDPCLVIGLQTLVLYSAMEKKLCRK